MKKFGLIGKRLDYSFSKTFFTDLFEKQNLACSYENIEIAGIQEIAPLLKAREFVGLNVTIPYKTEILPFLDELSPEAEKIGAVNTLFCINGKWIGYNTDAFGFKQSIKPFLINLHEKALILGTGGASKAVAYVLNEIGIDVFFISRSPKNKNEFSYEQINENMVNAMKLIVNCTPVGTFPAIEDTPNFPFEFLSKDHLVVDLIYNPKKTKFLQMAEENGATSLNGFSMLQEQALKAWDIWNQIT